MRKYLLMVLVILFGNALASDFLPAWQAFQVTLSGNDKQVVWVKFTIAPEYHIYQNKIKIKTLADSSVKLGKIVWPDPISIKSPDLGDFLVYEKKVAIQVPISSYGNGKLRVQINYQGCKGLDLCFPEQQARLELDLAAGKTAARLLENPALLADPLLAARAMAPSLSSLVSNNNSSQVADYFSNSPWLVVGGFFVLGLLIAFTPCVFPLLPILLTVVAGNNISSRRSFSLALSYILGGAVVYAAAGVIAANLGYSLAGALQASWLNIGLALLFSFFALALFAGFNIQLPLAWQTRLNHKINQQRNGSVLNSFIIGGIANLVLSPCVTAPLSGALLYITSSGNQLLGGAALFALGFGSGLPLLVIAVFGKQVLPKNGAWMLLIKKILAMLMLGMAIYMLSKGLAEVIINYLIVIWLVVISSLICLELKIKAQFRYTATIAAGLLVVFLSVQKFDFSLAYLNNSPSNLFINVKNNSELDQALLAAQIKKQPILLDYYAQWCVACKEMDLQTFSDPGVSKLLQPFTLIRVDITASDQSSRSLQQRYQVMAPPSLVFLNSKGKMLESYQITGFIDSKSLSGNLGKIIKQQDSCGTEC